MKYTIKATTKFKRQVKTIIKRGQDVSMLEDVIDTLANGEVLAERFCDHSLSGDYVGYRECHIAPDWLLIYKYDHDILVLTLYRTGSHSDLF